METRREFIKKAAMLSGAAGLWSVLPPSIQRAFAIEPELGSTYLDAEHVVILMQENRSFDHAFGALQGVRGFNDPRAITLPNNNPVWLQTNAAGETYAPFRLNIKDSNATWMGSLPHVYQSQVDARNDGKYDKWLEAKISGNGEYANIPFTMGHYSREDIPFYYSLADAFTVCDQYFCSSLTGTTPNRLYFWTGTIRERQSPDSRANVRNEDADYNTEVKWATFPERLEDAGVSWKIYQNELSLEMGLGDEEADWLANFGDNPLEYFTQYNVRFSQGYRVYLEKHGTADDRERWSSANFGQLSTLDKNLHVKAFCTNNADPDYHDLETLTYQDGDKSRHLRVPKGDIFHQFRQDVQSGSLPTVSWLVAPNRFSDHPDSAWYGAWYVSEALDILTQNPEVWKKTIFLLNYDENDGYFDHVPPFVVPNPHKADTGLVSKGIDTAVEYVTLEMDRQKAAASEARESPIGLGYRVPMVIASPWTRGGRVCSQVFDHTSVIQFLETFLTHKTGKQIEEPNVSQWRRTVCGDLTSSFQPYNGEKIELPAFVERDPFVEGIHKAKFKNTPSDFRALTDAEIEQIKLSGSSSTLLPGQEKGIRRSCALPYELSVDGTLSGDKSQFTVTFEALNDLFGKHAAGSPFSVYMTDASGEVKIRSYAVAAGDSLADAWNLNEFGTEGYRLKIYGPNGFFREFSGNANDPPVEVHLSGSALKVINYDKDHSHSLRIRDNAYKSGVQNLLLNPGEQTIINLNVQPNFGWYDFSVLVSGSQHFGKRYAGREETGKLSYSDPVMGGIIS